MHHSAVKVWQHTLISQWQQLCASWPFSSLQLLSSAADPFPPPITVPSAGPCSMARRQTCILVMALALLLVSESFSLMLVLDAAAQSRNRT